MAPQESQHVSDELARHMFGLSTFLAAAEVGRATKLLVDMLA
jgi:hypothetical protein